jgi:hypothetical protein
MPISIPIQVDVVNPIMATDPAPFEVSAASAAALAALLISSRSLDAKRYRSTHSEEADIDEEVGVEEEVEAEEAGPSQ